MKQILEEIITADGRELDEESLAKIRRYLETLGPGVKQDEAIYGLAYLQQLRNPDPRYSGC